jgi:alkylhydroperoxidase/carboxymuconolactone decarboxylase family protein YurZ
VADPATALDPKLEAFVRLAIDVSATHLYRPGVRRHIRSALDLGASRDEILEVITLMSVVGIHAPATGVPILEEELSGRGDAGAVREPEHPTPVCDWFRSSGQFNPDWELLHRWSPDWLERFLAVAVPFWQDGALPPLWVELLCVAGDAAVTHMYDSGTRRHIRTALELGATREQLLQVLQVVAEQGFQSHEVGLPILDEECARHDRTVLAAR